MWRLDAKSLMLYGYDTSIDPRGLQTLSADYATGASVATSYDPDGQPATVTYGNGLVRSNSYDETGALVRASWDVSSTFLWLP